MCWLRVCRNVSIQLLSLDYISLTPGKLRPNGREMAPFSQLTSTKSPRCGIRFPRNLPGLLGVVGRTTEQEWACNQLGRSSWFYLTGSFWWGLHGGENPSLEFLTGGPWLFIWQVVSQVYVNNHYTGNKPSKTKPNPAHECEKCHVSKIVISSLRFEGKRHKGGLYQCSPVFLFYQVEKLKVENFLALIQ